MYKALWAMTYKLRKVEVPVKLETFKSSSDKAILELKNRLTL